MIVKGQCQTTIGPNQKDMFYKFVIVELEKTRPMVLLCRLLLALLIKDKPNDFVFTQPLQPATLYI